MFNLTKESAGYLIEYFGRLMTPQEGSALRHSNSLYKLKGVTSGHLVDTYYEKGWLSKDPEVLSLLNDGVDQFIFNCVQRILKDSPDGVFFNLCPVCKKLARTPFAKQCRWCGHDWH